MITTVEGCARCGLTHEELEFDLLERPIWEHDGRDYTHWAPCPTNGQPILLRMLKL